MTGVASFFVGCLGGSAAMIVVMALNDRRQDAAREEAAMRHPAGKNLDPPPNPQWCPGCGATAPTKRNEEGKLVCAFCGWREP